MLQIPEQQRQKPHKQQIVYPGIEQGPGDPGGLHIVLTGLGQLHDGDDPGQGRVLHQGDDLVGHGRQDPLHHLKQGDFEEDLAAGEAQHLTGLPLTRRDGLDAAPVDHGEIAGVVQYKGHGARQHPVAAPDVVTEPQAGAVENDDQLQHQRRAPDHPHQGVEQRPHRAAAAHGAQGHQQAQRQGERQRQPKQDGGLAHPLQQG